MYTVTRRHPFLGDDAGETRSRCSLSRTEIETPRTRAIRFCVRFRSRAAEKSRETVQADDSRLRNPRWEPEPWETWEEIVALLEKARRFGETRASGSCFFSGTFAKEAAALFQ